LVIDVSSDPTKIAKHLQVELINVQLRRGEKRRTNMELAYFQCIFA
jgi:hypothetical protein